MYEGSDFLLMPSRFEPCGLGQMYAQSQASLPIAYRTGGLADTIDDGDTGFLFRDRQRIRAEARGRPSVPHLLVGRAVREMRQNALSKRFDWTGLCRSRYRDALRATRRAFRSGTIGRQSLTRRPRLAARRSTQLPAPPLAGRAEPERLFLRMDAAPYVRRPRIEADDAIVRVPGLRLRAPLRK